LVEVFRQESEYFVRASSWMPSGGQAIGFRPNGAYLIGCARNHRGDFYSRPDISTESKAKYSGKSGMYWVRAFADGLSESAERNA